MSFMGGEFSTGTMRRVRWLRPRADGCSRRPSTKRQAPRDLLDMAMQTRRMYLSLSEAQRRAWRKHGRLTELYGRLMELAFVPLKN
jgi:hypothetical protein